MREGKMRTAEGSVNDDGSTYNLIKFEQRS